MIVGIVADGKSEVDALPMLFPALKEATGHSFLRPAWAQVHPKGTVQQIAQAVGARLREQEARRADLVILLLDREERADCPGELALQIGHWLRQSRSWQCAVDVVIKDRTFENWLIADLAALQAQPSRFRPDSAAERSIVRQGADAFPALVHLKRWTFGSAYRKAEDSVRILEHADPIRMANTSRSFRRFLRCLGHPSYRHQSRLP